MLFYGAMSLDVVRLGFYYFSMIKPIDKSKGWSYQFKNGNAIFEIFESENYGNKKRSKAL
jgi:hypothetical protein